MLRRLIGGLVALGLTTAGAAATKVYLFVILSLISLSGTPTLTGQQNDAIVSWSCSATGGTGPYTYSVLSGALPTGVTLNASTCLVSGTPSVQGSFAGILIQAADANSNTARLPAFTMVISFPGNAFNIAATPTITGTVGTAVTPFTVTASGGSAPYVYSLYSGYLPPGTAIDPTTGVVSGTPTEDGTYTSIVLRATDSLNHTANLASFQWAVQAIGTVIAQPGTQFQQVFPTSGGPIFSMSGVTLYQRNSQDSLLADLDADGNYKGTQYYGSADNWPPGNHGVPALLPVTNSGGFSSENPFRIGTTVANSTIRGGRVLGSVSIYGDRGQMDMTSAAVGLPACYTQPVGGQLANATVSGSAASSTLTMATTAGLTVGMAVTGTNVGAGATISVITSATVVTLSTPNTGTVTKASFGINVCVHNYANSAGILADGLGGATTGASSIYKVRVDHPWDGIRPSSRPTSFISLNGNPFINATAGCCVNIVTQAWVSNSRDDAIEDDVMQGLTVTDSLFDGAYSGFSMDVNGVNSHTATDMLTLNGVLIRLQNNPNSADNVVAPYTSYFAPFKVNNLSPSITMRQSIIAVDGASASRTSRYNAGWTLMTNGIGTCVDSSTNSVTGLVGNYFLWLGDDAPHDLNTTGGGGFASLPACFTTQQGATARATWAAALAAEQAHLAAHGVFRLSTDP